MSHSALIIIDTQLGMYNGQRITPIFHGDQKLEQIKSLIQTARKKGITTIYIQHEGGEGHPLDKNAEGYSIHHKISPVKGDLIIKKKHPDSFLNTRLNEVLVNLSISNLYIVGNQTEYCIDTTCRSANSKGFRVILLRDCHSTWDTETLSATQIIDHHNATLEEGFVTLKNSEEISFDEFEDL